MWRFGAVRLLIPYIFVCGLCLSVNVQSSPNAISSSNPCGLTSDSNERINERGYVKIGGIDQWVTINGADCQNPIILIVHGGPGNPLSLYHKSLFLAWEEAFTVVHWDQRGAGKTYEKNQEIGELTMEQLANTELSSERLVRDGLGITDYIRKRMGQKKLIILGTSWGSTLAVKMVHKAPEKYHLYMGVSQLVNYHHNISESYKLVKSMATEKQDKEALTALDDMGSPPWVSPRNFGKLRRIIRRYESELSTASPDFIISEEYRSDKTRKAYFSGEEFSFVKFVGLRGDGMAAKIALDECCTKFSVPIYLVQGENDLLTTPKVTKSYFDTIQAPKKQYVLIEQSGHNPNIRMLQAQLDLLKSAMPR